MYRLMFNEVTPSRCEDKEQKKKTIPTVIEPKEAKEEKETKQEPVVTGIQQLTYEQTNRLTERQRTILKKTFAPMDEDPVKNALKMLVKLFSEYPRYKLIWPQFRAIPDSSLMHAVELRRHASVYMTGLHSIIYSMDDAEKLGEQLSRIARAHIKWNIHRCHITHMLEPVLEVIAECNGYKMDDETKVAWTTLYNVIADLIEIYRSHEKGQNPWLKEAAIVEMFAPSRDVRCKRLLQKWRVKSD